MPAPGPARDSRPASLLDAETVARAEALGVLARGVVEGHLAGEHRSPFRGFAIEFAQHREYAPGDDLRHLDWKVLGRTDRYYVKQYEQDTNFVAHLVLDGSGSMGFGSAGVTKFEFAARLLACLAYAVLAQRDAAAVQVFGEGLRESLPRTDALAKFKEVLLRLARLQPDGLTRLGASLHDLANAARRRGLVFLATDFFDDEAAALEGIQHLRFLGHEVVVFHVLDHAEMAFEFQGPVRFEGLENEGHILTRPADIRTSYLAEFDAFRARVRGACERNDCHYVLVDTSHSLAETLGAYLAFRHRVTAR